MKGQSIVHQILKNLNDAQVRLEEAGSSIHQVMICRCIPGYIADIMPAIFH